MTKNEKAESSDYKILDRTGAIQVPARSRIAYSFVNPRLIVVVLVLLTGLIGLVRRVRVARGIHRVGAVVIGRPVWRTASPTAASLAAATAALSSAAASSSAASFASHCPYLPCPAESSSEPGATMNGDPLLMVFPADRCADGFPITCNCYQLAEQTGKTIAPFIADVRPLAPRPGHGRLEPARRR